MLKFEINHDKISGKVITVSKGEYTSKMQSHRHQRFKRSKRHRPSDRNGILYENGIRRRTFRVAKRIRAVN